MKLLVSDYDGTYGDKQKDIKINNKYIEGFIKEGNLFVLSSGRPLNSLMGQIKKNNIPFTHLGTSDGNYLFDKEGNLLMENIMSSDIAYQIEELKSLGIFEDIQYAYPEISISTLREDQPLGSIAFVLKKKNITPRFLELYNKLKEEHPEYKFDIYGYVSAVYYMIRPLGIDKSSPIKHLEKELNIPKQKIFTIGDNINDIEMIRDYNGYMIGKNKSVRPYALKEYNAVYELVDDINKRKVLKRW